MRPKLERIQIASISLSAERAPAILAADIAVSARLAGCVWRVEVDELNGRMIACQILVTGLIARVANDKPDPLSFLTDFRDEIQAIVSGVKIAGLSDTRKVRETAMETVDELFSLMKAPSVD